MTKLTHSVITLTFLPSLLPAPHFPHIHPSRSLSRSSSLSDSTTPSESQPEHQLADLAGQLTARLPPRSFSARLAGAVGREFGGLLVWELPVTTMVQFNEVGT